MLASLPALGSQRVRDQQLCLGSRALRLPLRRLFCLRPFSNVRVCECVRLAVSASCAPILYEHERERESDRVSADQIHLATAQSPRCFFPIDELSACVCARVATLFIEPTRYCV